jgi:26S proteasome regulatory subunit N5
MLRDHKAARGANINSLLEQMRLESLRGSWNRVRVGSRKVNKVYLKEKETAVSCMITYFDRTLD